MNIIEAKAELLELKQKLNDLVGQDSHSRAEERALRDKIKALSHPLAIEETKLVIDELGIKLKRGKISQEDYDKRVSENRKKLEILGA